MRVRVHLRSILKLRKNRLMVKSSSRKLESSKFASSNLAFFIDLMLLQNYGSILIFFVISVILSIIIFFVPYALAFRSDSRAKLEAYECGFSPFSDSRGEFDIKFYLIGILFIIFDLELSFLFPFIVCFDNIEKIGLFSMYLFLFILTIGFVYE